MPNQNRCEGCEQPATNRDSEGIPLCAECAKACEPTEEALAGLIREFNRLAPDIAQLLDGWHTDVAWTEWDASVRKRLGELQQKADFVG